MNEWVNESTLEVAENGQEAMVMILDCLSYFLSSCPLPLFFRLRVATGLGLSPGLWVVIVYTCLNTSMDEGVKHPAFPPQIQTTLHTSWELVAILMLPYTIIFILVTRRGQHRQAGLWVMVSDGGTPPKMTGWLPRTSWDHQSLRCCPFSLLLYVSVISSDCKGFDSWSPRSHHRDPALHECLPRGPALLPHSGKAFHCQFCWNEQHHMGCHAHTGKQYVSCQFHLKRQT